MSFKRHKALTALPVAGQRNLCIGIDFVEEYIGGNPECYTLYVQAANHHIPGTAEGRQTQITSRDKEQLIQQALQAVEKALQEVLGVGNSTTTGA
jgi:hypothetical protein